jgi:hypothetical protein
VKLAGHCVVPTLEGNLFVKDLSEFKSFAHGFTWDGQRITIARIAASKAHVGVTTVVTLDDEARLTFACGAKVVAREGELLQAEELKPGTSLLPLYIKEENGYLIYREPGNWPKGAEVKTDQNRWRKVGRMVAEWKLGRRLRPGEAVRHADGRKRNNMPNNLVVEFRKRKKPKVCPKFAAPILEAHRFLQGGPNHEVVSANAGVSQELFSLRVMDSDNLAVNGIFVSSLPG